MSRLGGFGSAGADFMRFRSEQDDGNDEDLADEHQAPRARGRHPAADHRTGRDRGRCDATDDPVGQRPLLALVVLRDERRDRRDHEHRAEALDQRPAEEQDGEVRADGRDERARGVDHQADREGTIASPDVAELRADEHERGHDQGVRGDGQLDALDRRVQVGHDLRDRHVHDAAVEHHHELRRGKNRDRRPVPHGVMVRGAGKRVAVILRVDRQAAATVVRDYLE